MLNLRKIRRGDKPTLARAISLIENEAAETGRLSGSLYPYLGKAHRIGITGPPGVGKSTLTNELTALIRKKRQTIGIIAVDPTSVFTGGAILGDRIRMQKVGLDKGVFIRSMATRGCSGGIARATSAASDVLDAAGKDYIIIETVGAGQAEIEIFKAVDTTIVVLSPESGDAIQAMKSGLMEIADMVVVNKSDRPGADLLINSLKNTLEYRPRQRDIPLLKTEAINGQGLEELLEHLEIRWKHLKRSGILEEKRRNAMRMKLKSMTLNRLEAKMRDNKKIDILLNKALDKIMKGKETPDKVVGRIVKRYFRATDKRR